MGTQTHAGCLVVEPKTDATTDTCITNTVVNSAEGHYAGIATCSQSLCTDGEKSPISCHVIIAISARHAGRVFGMLVGRERNYFLTLK